MKMVDRAGQTQIYITGIAAATTREDLESHFKAYDGGLERYKSSQMGFNSPFGFVWIPDEKVQALLADKHEVNGANLTLELAKPVEAIKKYFLDSRLTKGSLCELSRESIEAYFALYGEVKRVVINKEKGIGFLDIANTAESPEDINKLAWLKHTIEGHVINVEESTSQRKRRKRNKHTRNKRQKTQ